MAEKLYGEVSVSELNIWLLLHSENHNVDKGFSCTKAQEFDKTVSYLHAQISVQADRVQGKS